MPSRRKRKSFSAQAADLALAVPVVMALRVARIALAGTSPSARDRRELHRMTAEKIAAFHESWVAMTFESLRASQSIALSMLQFPWTRPGRNSRYLRAHARRAALGILAEATAPIHRRVVGNARRLRRARLR